MLNYFFIFFYLAYILKSNASNCTSCFIGLLFIKLISCATANWLVHCTDGITDKVVPQADTGASDCESSKSLNAI